MLSFDSLLQTDQRSDLCVFGYCGANLGDHIQTLALLHHVRPREFVFRDSILPHRELTLVANGWMTHGQFPVAGDFRDVRFAGIHLGHRHRTPEVVEALRPDEMVGCRDAVTQAFLARHGVASSLSGCVTLTLPPYAGPRENVICVDLSPKAESRVKWKLGGHGPVLSLSHTLPKCSPSDMTVDRMKGEMRRAYDYLQLYRRAKVVITGRIHVALPCIAFGTPVIVFRSSEDRSSVFDGMGIEDGSEQFRWYSMRPWGARLPSPITSAPWRARYMEFFSRLQLECRRDDKSVASAALA